MRYARQNKILELIENNEIETQEKLSSMLRENGFDVTQATISRENRDDLTINNINFTVSVGYKF